jgi:hypothetical protein
MFSAWSLQMRIDLGRLAPAERDALSAELARLTMLEDVVRWGHAQKPPRGIADVVIQDEYTHDVVMPLAPGRWLVFETT